MSILVTGGCGCVGFHLVKALLSSRDFDSSQIHVVSRNPTRNLIEDARVHYHAADIGSQPVIAKLLRDIQPRIIFHTAAPVARGNSGSWASFYRTSVQGTQNLLTAAPESVRAFIYTSSVSVMQGPSYNFTKEDHPTYSKRSEADAYTVTKSLADKIVLQANRPPSFKTVCMRIASVYGERDEQMIAGTLEVMQTGYHTTQIGDNTNLLDVVSVENVANAHLLAANALLQPSVSPAELRVDGEAFNVTDGDPLPFWDFERMIWNAAGANITADQIKVIPAWFMLSLASLVEWIYWIFTLGQKRPQTLRRHVMEYTVLTRTFSIEKARQRLGYVPVRRRDHHIKAGVDWAMHRTDEAAVQKSSR